MYDFIPNSIAAIRSIGIHASFSYRYTGINGLKIMAIIPNAMVQNLIPFLNSLISIIRATINMNILRNV